jgi:SAM-dependent methyltransferase
VADIYESDFAGIYDTLIRGDYSYSEYADYIEALFVRRGAHPTLVCDLGCGTGSLCVELAGRGYEMIGIDRSPEMLDKAREKAIAKGVSDILLLNQEIDEFELFGSVGAFLSTIDSLNYVTDKRALRRVFQLVGNYLDPGGLFIFDLNTRHKLSRVLGDNFFYDVSDEVCYLWQNSYDSRRRSATFDLTFFTREGDGRWRRFDEVHTQRAYDEAELLTAAKGTPLSLVGAYAHLRFVPPAADAEKICYVFQKSTGD